MRKRPIYLNLLRSYRKGFPTVTLSTSAGDAYKNAAEFVQREWRENLGVDIKIGVADFATVIGNLVSGNFEMSREAYSAPFPHDIKFFEQFTKGNHDNYPRYDNPEYDALIFKARSEPDQSVRNRIFKQAEEILHRDPPTMPLFYTKRTYLLRRGILGFEPNLTQKHMVKYIRRK